jgi:hypothetical protein
MKRYERDADQREWRRSSFCQSGECAEVLADEAVILVRSSRNPDLVVELTLEEWGAFADGIRAGEFDGMASRTES